MLVLLLVAFVSGLFTILAPCIWPILPIVLSSSATGGHRKPLGVTIGILLSFTLLTLSLSYLVSVFNFDPDTLRLLAVLVIGFLGIVLVVPKLSAVIESYTSRLSSIFGGNIQNGSGFWGGLVVGVSLGIVWAPCAGPILATIAALSATRAVTAQVVLITVVYMIGTGIPLLLFATFGNKLLTKSRVLSPLTGKIQQILGAIMILTAAFIWTSYDKIIQAKLLDLFPGYSNFIYKIEQSNQVQEQLNRLQGRETNTVNFSGSYLPKLGMAPDFRGISGWLNTEPLTMESLKGKVVLIDFWTYSCINCIRTLPFVTGWYEKYKDQGFVVVGVHTPEFEFEKKAENVQNSLNTFKINYPVAQDNGYGTWNNYNNSYWPAKYLIDKDGQIRYKHFGEGEYAETERAIQTLLAETGSTVPTDTLSLKDETPTRRLTPETYIGKNRAERFSSVLSLSKDWSIQPEYAESVEGSKLELNFFASKVFLVITPATMNDSITVILDGKVVESNSAGKDVVDGKVILDEPRLYEILDLKDGPDNHKLQLNFGTKGTQIFAFTFG